MPLSSRRVGAAATVRVNVDARWLMAYSAVVGVSEPRWFDTEQGVVAHPVFPVAPEWALMTSRHDPFDLGLTRDEVLHGIHASHDIMIHRAVRAGDTLIVQGEVMGMRQIRSGAMVSIRFISTDQFLAPVTTTWEDMVYLGVTLRDGDALASRVDPTPSPGTHGVRSTDTCYMGIGAAHLYTECARIWNPIHTDITAARRAGLERTILHGTATLAVGVTSMLRRLDIGPDAVRRVSGRFSGMVALPSTLEILTSLTPPIDGEQVCQFEIRSDGARVLDRGIVTLAERAPQVRPSDG